MSERLQGMLGGYATDTLDPAERRELFSAALVDQALFDALAGEQPLRDLLSDAAIRRELLLVVSPRRAWLPPLALAAGLGAVALAGFLWTRHPERPDASADPQPWAQPISRHADDVAPRLFALAPRGTASLSIHPAGPLTGSQTLTITARVAQAANLLLLERLPDGNLVQLFPTALRPFSRVAPGVDLEITQPTGAPGTHVLRLLAFPTETDPSTLTPSDLPALAGNVEVAEVRYQVVTP